MNRVATPPTKEAARSTTATKASLNKTTFGENTDSVMELAAAALARASELLREAPPDNDDLVASLAREIALQAAARPNCLAPVRLLGCTAQKPVVATPPPPEPPKPPAPPPVYEPPDEWEPWWEVAAREARIVDERDAACPRDRRFATKAPRRRSSTTEGRRDSTFATTTRRPTSTRRRSSDEFAFQTQFVHIVSSFTEHARNDIIDDDETLLMRSAITSALRERITDRRSMEAIRVATFAHLDRLRGG